jgi:hypothetical protein
MQRVARVSKGKQAKFEQRAGESIGSYLVSRNIFGTPDQIVDQLYERMKGSMKNVDKGLAQVPGTYKDPSFLRAARELLERETRVGGVGAKSPDSPRIEELFKKVNNEGLTLTEANELKRLYERNVKLDFLKQINAEGVERANRIDTGMREFIVKTASDNGFDTVTALNKETSLAKQLLDDIGAEYAGSAGNNAIGLTDTIFLAEALGNPVAAIGFGVKKGLGSKAVQSTIAKAISRNAGSKADLPKAQFSEPKFSGYLEFLEKQKGSFNQGEIPKLIETGTEQYSPKLINQLREEMLSDKSKAVILDSDSIKKGHPDYDPKNPQPLHKESSAIQDAFYDIALEEDTSGVVKFTGGGRRS